MKNWKLDYTPDEVEDVPCPFCGAYEALLIARECSLGIKQCIGCDLVYVSPRIKQPEKNYWFDEQSIVRKYASVFAGGPHDRDRNYMEVKELLRRFKPSGRLLDVGTHCGFFLRTLKDGDWELHGIEPSPVAAKLARERFGLDVKEGYLEGGMFASETYDIVTALDVLEHVTNPLAFLRTVHNVLKADGILVVKTPNLNWNRLKYRARLLGWRDSGFDVFDSREHVVQFTEKSLAMVLHAAGLEVDFLYTPLPIQTLGQSGRWWRMPLRSTAYWMARAAYALTDIPGFAPDLGLVASKSNRDRSGTR